MKILLTAFDPFGGDAYNASAEILAALPDTLGGAVIEKAVVPTSFARCAAEAAARIEACSPDAVLCLGQAAGRDALTPERVAINIMDARIPDNDGFCPRDLPIAPDGPAAYFSTLPLRAMLAAMESAGVGAKLSDTAGTFVCNCLMYSLLHRAAVLGPAIPCGFLHVPRLIGRGDGPGPAVDFSLAVRGVAAAAEVIAHTLL